jgi:hypothetical protein
MVSLSIEKCKSHYRNFPVAQIEKFLPLKGIFAFYNVCR